MPSITVYESTEPYFELHGIKLFGSFQVYFVDGKWYFSNFEYKQTEVSGEDIKKLAEASKSAIEVPIKFGNGEGKAIVRSFYYDPEKRVLTKISIGLTEWTPK